MSDISIQKDNLIFTELIKTPTIVSIVCKRVTFIYAFTILIFNTRSTVVGTWFIFIFYYNIRKKTEYYACNVPFPLRRPVRQNRRHFRILLACAEAAAAAQGRWRQHSAGQVAPEDHRFRWSWSMR